MDSLPLINFLRTEFAKMVLTSFFRMVVILFGSKTSLTFVSRMHFFNAFTIVAVSISLRWMTSVSTLVSFDEESGDESAEGNPDYDTFKSLEHAGDKIFGHPSGASGELVSKWTPESSSYPEELGEYHEGDILHPVKSSRNGLRIKSSRWPNKTIPYEISPYMRGSDRQIINEALEEFHQKTCLKFKERRYTDTDYVYFTNDNTGCWSSVGRIGGRQEINLQSPGCTTKKGTVIHEMLHAIGFMHEQNRPDRDKYVVINYQNIQRGKEPNFEKATVETVDNQGIGYDYHSVMHYSGNAFSVNGLPTIEPKVRDTVLGQRDGLSKKDMLKIQKMYKCKGGRRPNKHPSTFDD